jgi:hypothetical protein
MRKVFILMILLVLNSCSKKEDETTCLPLPNNIDINIVDKISGENIFTIGMFSLNQVQIITNPVNQFPVNFTQNAGPNTLTTFPIKTEGFINFSIVLNNEITIPLKGNIVINNACGTNYYFESITTEDTNFVVEKSGTNLKIKI